VSRPSALLALVLMAASRSAYAFEVETLRESGPVDKRFNIAVLGDGYRTEDQAKLTTDAQEIIGYLFGVTPIKQYEKFFNVKLVHVVSNQNGADDGTAGGDRDTALDAYFGCGGIDRLLCVNDGKVATIAATDVPEHNFAIVIVNDEKYGGSGGPVVACSANDSSFEVMAHEVGHSLARLADEYSYEGNQPPCSEEQDCSEANVTLRSSRDQIKWRDWIEGPTPIPTPDDASYEGVVGLFEGARYTPMGVYRPQRNCKMRDLGAEYCPVCTEQFVRSIWTADNVQMIESATPAQPKVVSMDCEAIELGVTTPPITPSTYEFRWSIDGKPTVDTASSVRLLPAELSPGEHEVKLSVEDATAMVRKDVDEVLKDSFAWMVSVTKGDCPLPAGGAAGAGGGGGAGAAGAPLAGAAGAGAGGVAGSDGQGGVASGPQAGAGTGGAARPAPPPRASSGCGCLLAAQAPAGAATLGSLLALSLLLALRRGAQTRLKMRAS
jgi:hypothetical protein